MPMYNFLEYSENYSMTSGSLWNNHRDEVNDDVNKNNAARNKINNNKTIIRKSFEYKTKLIGSIPSNNILDAEIAVPLKYLDNFWRSLDFPFINCEIKLYLSWSKECIISEISITSGIAGNPRANPLVSTVITIQTTRATFQIDNVKLYVPVVNLAMNDNIKFLENIKQEIKKTISWNNYRSEITTQTKNNNLHYLIDPPFRSINRLLVLSLKNGKYDPTRVSFDKYYMSLVEINDFKALINNKPFLDLLVKNKQEAHQKPIKMSRNDDYTKGNLLNY